MYWKKQESKKIFYLSIVLVFLVLNFIMINFNNTPNAQNNEKSNNSYINLHENLQERDFKSHGTVEDEFTNEWLQNGNFTSGTDPWYNTTEGDSSDVKASYSDGAANYEVLGNNGSFSIINSPPSSSDWTPKKNPDFPLKPNGRYAQSVINSGYGIDGEGCWATHEYDESINQTDNFPSIHFERNVNMPVNMSDYIITSASVSAYFNATATTNLEVDGDEPLDTGGYHGVWDWVRFYVLISDLDKLNEYQIANYKTDDLGSGYCDRDDLGNLYYMGDTAMIPVDDPTLIYYLTSVLSRDYRNFTITLGIHIYAEDNYDNYDWDTFRRMLIKNFSLSISYEKKIDPLTSLSWNQIGNEIPSGSNVDISKAVLNFSYQINETWSTSLSPNSEIRMIINDTQHSESIKLSAFSTEWQTSSFDVTYPVLTTGKGVNISLSIQVYLADEFRLDRVIKISIDNVSLKITYTIGTTEEVTELELSLNGIDKSLDKSIEVAWRETINITVTYRNSTSDPILGALVDVNGTGISEILNPIGSNYSVLINSTDLAFGNNYLTLHAEKKYYESITETIKITVVDRPTYLDNIYLNYTEQSSINMQYNEILNITVSYNDTLSNDFISGATVSLNGTGISEPMPENSQKQYSVEINTTDLTLGLNFLTISAQKENYSLTSEAITIAVNLKDTYLDVSFNGTSTTQFDYYNISIGEKLNITAWYREADTSAFIDSATVDLICAPIGTQPMPHHHRYDQYNITINATDLGVGVQFLTISAQKENFTSRSVTVSVIIYERATNIRLWLNKTEMPISNPSITLNVNETLNITVTYRDFVSSEHLSEADGAGVRIFGSGIDDNFNEDGAHEQYTYFLNSSNLPQGVNFVNILAERDGYESQYILLSIIITERNTSIELFLNGTDFTHISYFTYNLTIGEYLNITIKYNDWLTGAHIDLASVDLEGEGINKPLLENNKLGHYSIILDSEDLNQGINFLTVTAQKPNYQYRQKQIKIEIADKASIMSLYINGENRTSDTLFNFYWGEFLNITIFYQENESRQLINDATIELIEGSILLYNLTRNAFHEQYNRTINTADLGVGIRSLQIIAAKENFKTITKDIIITVSERDTYLEIYVNNTSYTTFESFNATLGELLNITVWYRDNDTNDFIYSASVTLSSQTLPKHPIYNQYNITLLANDLSLDDNYLQIVAQKDNYSIQIETIKITVSERIAEFQLLINGTQIAYNGNKSVDVTQKLNITVTFRDTSTTQHIPGANILLAGVGASPLALNEIPNDYYNIILNVTDIKQEGVAILTIDTEKTNYQVYIFQFKLYISQKETNLDIFFNGVNVSTSPAITFPIGTRLNLTVKYTDINGIHILNANVSLSLDFTANIHEHSTFQQYSIIIDTNLLKIGINTIGLEAKKPNHRSQVINLYLTVRKIRTLIETEDGDDTITIKAGENVKIKIIITDLDFGGGVVGAEVTFDSKLEDGDLDDEGGGLYEVKLKEVPEGTYTITISVYKAGGRYEFEDFEITLVAEQEEGEFWLWLILFIIACIAIGALSAYFLYYYYVLRFPKPVRKVRKYRRKLKKKAAPSVNILSRDKAFSQTFSDKMKNIPKLKALEKPILPIATEKKLKSTIEKPKKPLKEKPKKPLKEKPKKPLKEKPKKPLKEKPKKQPKEKPKKQPKEKPKKQPKEKPKKQPKKK